jgi:hypothetical protein
MTWPANRRIYSPLLVFLTVLITYATTARATTFPADGGKGDRAEIYTCPANYVLVGFSGRTGAWIDKLGLICSEVFSPDYKTGHPTSLPQKGGNGGSPSEQYCTPNAAIRSLDIFSMSRSYHSGLRPKVAPYTVGQIEFSCMRPATGQSVTSGMFGGDMFGRVKVDDIFYAGHSVQACPGQEYATGLNIRYGQHVNAIGLICGPVVARRRP